MEFSLGFNTKGNIIWIKIQFQDNLKLQHNALLGPTQLKSNDEVLEYLDWTQRFLLTDF